MMHYATLRRLSAYTDSTLRQILNDATLAYAIASSPEQEAASLEEISNVAHVLHTRAVSRIGR